MSSVLRSLLAWIEGGLLVAEARAAGSAVLRVDVATGELNEWRIIDP